MKKRPQKLRLHKETVLDLTTTAPISGGTVLCELNSFNCGGTNASCHASDANCCAPRYSDHCVP